MTVTVLGDSKGRGGVIIPASRESWGWHGLSEELDGLLNPKADANHGDICQRPPAGKAPTQGNFRNEFCSFKAAVIQGKNLPKILPINPRVDNFSGEINAENVVVLKLKVKLTCDQDGSWKASWARLDDSSNGLNQAPKSGPVNELKPASKPSLNPRQIQKVWKPIRPKPNNLATDPEDGAGSSSFRPVSSPHYPELNTSNRFSVFQIGETSGSCDPPESESRPMAVSCTVVPPQAEPSAPNGSGLVDEGAIVPHASAVPGSELTKVDRTWGSSSEWVFRTPRWQKSHHPSLAHSLACGFESVAHCLDSGGSISHTWGFCWCGVNN